MENKKKVSNIYQRFVDVMDEVKYIQKTEKAAKGLPYTYVSHDDVTGALHSSFVRFGIVAETSVESLQQDGNRTLVNLRVSFVNIDNPKDRITVNFYGYGIDNQDKGIGKAISYAFKMACLKNFMLETGEDPEKSNIDYSPDQNIKVTSEQALEIQSVLTKFEEKEQQRLLEILNVEKVENIPQSKFEAVMKALKRKLNGESNGNIN